MIPAYLMSESHYNDLVSLQGKETIDLSNQEYLITVSNESILGDSYSTVLNDKLTIYGKEYKSVHKDVVKIALQTEETSSLPIIIVSDEILSDKAPVRYVMSMNYKDKDMEEAFQNDLKEAYGDDYRDAIQRIVSNNQVIKVDSKVGVIEQTTGITSSIIFVTIYIAIVFLLTSAVILALQQLTEAEDNRFRYNLLSKLGANEKMLNKALFIQIFIYFMMPLTLALCHATVGLVVANDFINSKMDAGLFGNIAFTLVVFLVVYGGYFLTTYYQSKSIIQK